MKKALFLIACLCSVHSALGEESIDEWAQYYYKNPSPERFVGEVQRYVEVKLFEKPNSRYPIIAFLSQVMAQNPTSIERWLKEFEHLDESQREILLLAAWYSEAEPAQSYFEQHGLDDYLKLKAPKILEMEVDDPRTLDRLWGYFMATGDLQPIRRIVTAFSLSKYSEALDRFKTSEKTEQDKKEAYWGVTFRAAMWSLESNCHQHPLVLQHCKAILKEEELPEDQRRWFAIVLAKVKASNELPL